MSFSCPHFDIKNDRCLLLKKDCVPGRRGCVLAKTSKFVYNVEDKMKNKEKKFHS